MNKIVERKPMNKDEKKRIRKRKYNIATDEHGHFFFNGVDVTNEWYWHFAGLDHEQEHRCVQIFTRWLLRNRPELKVERQTK